MLRYLPFQSTTICGGYTEIHKVKNSSRYTKPLVEKAMSYLYFQFHRKKLILTTKPALVQDGCGCRLIGVSICWDATETDSQFTVFDLPMLKMQCLIPFSLGLGRVWVPTMAKFIHFGAEIVVAIRPEKLTILKERGSEDSLCAEGVMKAASYLGDRSHCYLSVEGLEKPLAIATQETEIPSSVPLSAAVGYGPPGR